MRTQRRTKAVGYVRVSSEQQATEGVSLDAQRYKMRAYCKAMDIDLIDIIADEGYSASNLKRPGLQAALTMLRSGKACTLIVRQARPADSLCQGSGDAVRAVFFRRQALYAAVAVGLDQHALGERQACPQCAYVRGAMGA